MIDPDPATATPKQISISSNSSVLWRVPFSLSELRLALICMWEDLSCTSSPVQNTGYLELAILNDAEIAEINLTHLNSPGPTNVLAFPAKSIASMPVFNSSKACSEQVLEQKLVESAENTPKPPSGLLLSAATANIYIVEESECGDTVLPSSASSPMHSLGWLAMSAETMSREALVYNCPLNEYILRLLAHGMAHLVGYDHCELMDNASNSAMRAAIIELHNQGRK